jgi:hypothetical protein
LPERLAVFSDGIQEVKEALGLVWRTVELEANDNMVPGVEGTVTGAGHGVEGTGVSGGPKGVPGGRVAFFFAERVYL